MSQIKATQRLVVEDFPGQKDWIQKLLFPINRFVTEVVAILNGGIEFEKNITGVERDLDFVYHTTALPVGFKWTLAAKPSSLSVLQMTENGSSIIGLVSWAYTADGLVNITSAVRFTSAPAVAALQSGSRYKIKVRVTP